MEDAFFDAVRGVVNFARFDKRYLSLEKRREEQLAYFNQNFTAIAAENGVDEDELRAFLIENIDAKSLGVDLARLPNGPTKEGLAMTGKAGR